MRLATILFLVFVFVIAFADKYEAKAASITVSGNTLIFKGPVKLTDVKTFKNLFTNKIKIVQLTSRGGSSKGGYQMAMLLSKRSDVVVYAKDYCKSACAAMWLGAKKQAKPNIEGVVGFHLSHYGKKTVEKSHNYKEKYGWNGIEYLWKRLVLTDLINDTMHIDNKSSIHMFIKGLKSDGLLGHNMWNPSFKVLQTLEGNFVPLPASEAISTILKDSSGVWEYAKVKQSNYTWDSSKNKYRTFLILPLKQTWKIAKVEGRLFTSKHKSSQLTIETKTKKSKAYVWTKTIPTSTTSGWTVWSNERPSFYELTITLNSGEVKTLFHTVVAR